MEKPQTTLSLQLLEKSSESFLREGTVLHDIVHRERLKQVAQAKRSGFSLPFSLLQSQEIAKGIKELDNFGFHTTVAVSATAVLMDPAGNSAPTMKVRKRPGFHVSDLWSQKQQQEFHRRLRLERAQFAKERQVSFVNYLVENRKKLSRPVEVDLQHARNAQNVDLEMKRISSTSQVRLSQRALTYSEGSRSDIQVHEFSLPPSSRHSRTRPFNLRLQRVEGLIGQCSDTLESFKRGSRDLTGTTRSLGSRADLTFSSVSAKPGKQQSKKSLRLLN